MRKKLFSGLLLVTAVLFATGAFTSCKDSYSDDIADTRVGLEQQINTLKNNLQQQIDALRTAQQECKDNCKTVQDGLKAQIDALEAALAAGNAELAQKLQEAVTNTSDALADLQAEDVLLGGKIETLNEKIAALETLLKDVDLNQISVNKQNIETLLNTVTGISETLEVAKATADAANLLANTANENAKAAGKAAEAAKAAADSAQAAADEAKAAAAKAQEAADKAQEATEKNAANIETVKTGLATLEEKFAGLDTRVAEVEKSVIAVQAQADAALALAQANSVCLDELKAAFESLSVYSKEEVDSIVDSMIDELDAKIAENKMAIEDAKAAADKAYDLANKAYDLADDAKTIALQALNNAAINAGNIAGNTQDIEDIKGDIEGINGQITDINTIVNGINEAYQAADNELWETLEYVYEYCLNYSYRLANQVLNILYDELGDLDEHLQYQLDALQDQLDALQDQLDELKEQHAKDVEALKKQITGIIVQGTYNPVFGQFSLPVGVNSTMLCALYGNYTEADTEWPSEVIDLAIISKTGNTISLENGQTLVSDGDKACAGKLYLTVNPAETDFEGVDFTLETSAGNVSVFDMSPLQKSTDELAFGWTRAGVPNFYESQAYIDILDLEDAKITKNINLDELKTVAKDILNRLRGKGNADIAGAINTFCGSFSGILPAYAAKVTAEDETIGTTTVVSNYNIAATAWKPFSYDFLKDYNMPQFPTFSPLDVEFNVQFDEVQMPDTDADFWVVLDSDKTIYGFFTTYDEAVYYKNNKFGDAGEVVKLDKITEALEGVAAALVKDIESLEEQINQKANNKSAQLQDKINSKIISRVNNAINKVNNKIKHINQYLQPTLLYQSKSHGWLTASTVNAIPTPAPKGKIELNATSYTNEIFAPAFKKFVAVTAAPSQKAMNAANGGANMAKVLEGDVKQVVCEFTEPGVYEVSYAAIDYSGKTVVTKHYFKVY